MIPIHDIEAALASLLALFGSDASGCTLLEKDGELHLVRPATTAPPK